MANPFPGMPLDQPPEAWLADDLKQDQSWIRALTAQERDGLLAGLRVFERETHDLHQSTAADFPFERIGDLLADIRRALMHQYGLILIRSFPIEGLTEGQIIKLYWGFVNHIGVLRPQGKDSNLINHVKNTGGVYRATGGRGYNTNAELDFHVDFGDAVGLLCLQDAKVGGMSRCASSRALFETLRRDRSDLAAALQEPLFYSRQNEHASDEPPFYQTPIVAIEQGWFACRYTRNHIRYAHLHEGARAATPMQNEAMDWLDAHAREDPFMYEMRLQPGDFQFLNNHVTVHSRTAYEDDEDPARRRNLLRSWIALPYSQPLALSMREAFHDHRSGSVRGGIKGQHFDQAKRAYTRAAAHYHGMRCDVV